MQTTEQRQRMNTTCIKLYQRIAAFIRQFGYPPNYREMAKLMDIKSISQVRGYLAVLESWNWIAMTNGKRRILQLTRPTEKQVHLKIRKQASAVSDRLGKEWSEVGES